MPEEINENVMDEEFFTKDIRTARKKGDSRKIKLANLSFKNFIKNIRIRRMEKLDEEYNDTYNETLDSYNEALASKNPSEEISKLANLIEQLSIIGARLVELETKKNQRIGYAKGKRPNLLKFDITNLRKKIKEKRKLDKANRIYNYNSTMENIEESERIIVDALNNGESTINDAKRELRKLDDWRSYSPTAEVEEDEQVERNISTKVDAIMDSLNKTSAPSITPIISTSDETEKKAREEAAKFDEYVANQNNNNPIPSSDKSVEPISQSSEVLKEIDAQYHQSLKEIASMFGSISEEIIRTLGDGDPLGEQFKILAASTEEAANEIVARQLKEEPAIIKTDETSGQLERLKELRKEAEMLQASNTPIDPIESFNLTSAQINNSPATDLAEKSNASDEIKRMMNNLPGEKKAYYAGLLEGRRIREEYERKTNLESPTEPSSKAK